MIIDAHVHVMTSASLQDLGDKIQTSEDLIAFRTRYPELFALASTEPPLDNSDDLLAELDRHGIGYAVVMAKPGPIGYEEVAKVVAKHPDRLFGLFSFAKDQQLTGVYLDDPTPIREQAVAEIPHLDLITRRHVGHRFGGHHQGHNVLVQDLVVAHVMRQCRGRALPLRRHEHRGAGNPCRMCGFDRPEKGLDRRSARRETRSNQLATGFPGGHQRKKQRRHDQRRSAMHRVRRRHAVDVSEPIELPRDRSLRGGDRADRRRHALVSAGLRDLRGGDLLRRRREPEDAVRGGVVGP